MNNRRTICLNLTAEGEALRYKVSEIRRSQLIKSFQQLTAEDEEHLYRIHGKIADILHKQRKEENHT